MTFHQCCTVELSGQLRAGYYTSMCTTQLLSITASGEDCVLATTADDNSGQLTELSS